MQGTDFDSIIIIYVYSRAMKTQHPNIYQYL